MSLDRVTILKSPGKLVHDSAALFSEGDITAALVTEHFPVETSAFGPAAARVKDRMVKISLTPKTWSDLTKLFPYATKQIGDTIFGATDLPAVITPRTGAPLTVANCAVTKLPSILLSGHRPILGGLELTGLVANNSDPATVANFLAFGSPATGVGLTGFDAANVPNGLYSATWNSIALRSATGFAIDFSLGLEPDSPDGEPTLNYRLTSLEATCKFTPVGMTEANYLTLLGLNKGIGATLATSNLVITGAATGMPIVTIANCFAEGGSVGWGRNIDRTGEVTLRSIRTQTSGSLNALWTFGTVS